jgi:hypothetical protein
MRLDKRKNKMANEGFFSRMGALPGKRYDDFMEQTRRYQEGEIGIGDQMLQGGANALGLLTDIPLAAAGEAISFVTPDIVKKGLGQLAEGISQTDAAQAAMEYAAENPQMMKRLGYVADLSVVPAARVAKRGMLQDLSMEAPNRQPSFYGSGRAGQVASIARTAPTAVVDAFSPKAAASRRQGLPMSVRREADKITPQRRQKAAEIRNKKPADRTEEEGLFLRDFNKDLSFLEGQLDQTQLLSAGRNVPTQGVVRSFEKVQAMGRGQLSPEVVSRAASMSEPLRNKGIKPTQENIAVIEENIRKAQGIGPTENVEVVIRNPTAFSDIAKESLKGSNKKASRVFYARDSLRKHFPDKSGFTDQELKEFVALTRLPDDKLYNLETGKEASRFEKELYKMTESKKFGTKGRSDKETVDMYYKYKKMEQEGTKLRKPQQEIYDGMKARIAAVSDTLDLRGDTVYFQGSHKSSAKGLGGVNDQYMVNKKGDFVHFINDENDLFGQTVPGDKRVLSVVAPNGYNVFAPAGRVKGQASGDSKEMFQRELQQLGAEPVSKRPEGMLEQAAVGIQRQAAPNVRASDYRNLAAAGALGTGASRER